jgi:hypothetical protein
MSRPKKQQKFVQDRDLTPGYGTVENTAQTIAGAEVT